MKLKFSSILLITFCLGFVFNACSEKSDAPEGDGLSTSMILGFWSTDSSDLSLSVNDTALVDYLKLHLGLNDLEAKQDVDSFKAELKKALTGFIDFKNDYTFNATFEGVIENGVWEINESETILTLDKGTNKESILTIVLLNETASIMEFPEEEDIDLDDDGADETRVDIAVKMYLNR